MGFWDSKDDIMMAALKMGGAFDNGEATDYEAAFGVAIGASLGLGQDWTVDDSLRLGAAISVLDTWKSDSCHGTSSRYDSYEEDDLYLTIDQEEQLEAAGIDVYDFECMDSYERRDALEAAGFDPYDFDM